MKKKIIAIILFTIFACSICALSACNVNNGPANKTEAEAYVSLDINPAIELIVDKDNVVVSVIGENEDAQVLLYEETGIVGEKIDQATKKITDLAIKYGYLNEDNTVVDAIVSSEDEKFAEDVLGTVNTSITATAEGLGLSVIVDGEGAYSLLRQMEEIKKQYPNNEAIQNMSVAKFKLALSVSEKGETSLEVALTLDDAELIEMLKSASAKIEQFATEAYLAAKAKALALYDQATEIAGYGVYMQYYIEKVLSHPMTAYYGGVYSMYASAAKGIDIVCDTAEFVIGMRNYPLDEEQVATVVSALGLESADVLKNSDGEITIASIEAYADKQFKNTPASEALEQQKQALSEALAQAEIVLKDKVNELSAEYKPQIETVIAEVRQIMAALDGMTIAMPESVKTIINTTTAELKTILTELDEMLADGKIEISELREKADRLEAKADEYLEKINADLTEEEKAELEERKESVISAMTEQKAVLEKALADAEQAAREYLANLKASRVKE